MRAIVATLAAAVSTAAFLSAPALAAAAASPAAASPAAAAPGAPGTLSRFDLARKDCVGTARNDTSKVWFTVADGVLSDVYEPTIDNSNVQTMQYIVTDGSTFTDLQQRDLTYTVQTDPTGMTCTVIATSAAHHYQLVSTYLTDPAHDSVIVRTTVHSAAPLHVYARLDAHVNGNGGGGTANGGADSGMVSAGVATIGDQNTVSQAANRDYAVPTYMSLRGSPVHGASVGYEDAASDGLTQLDAGRALTPRYASAPNGHIVATEDVTPAAGQPITLALGFGRDAAASSAVAAATLQGGYDAARRTYTQQWATYDTGLRRPAGTTHRNAYYLSANVLRASEDKTFPGAIVASLASPWGQAVSAGDLPGGKPVYFGSYREVFARDLYEAVTGLIADGDLDTARAATTFLLTKQQGPTGELPRNSLLNGEVAPDTGGDQLDETAYPILMAYLTGLGSDTSLYRDHIVPAANFLVAHGPSFGVERWEEQSGYSPSTIAAEIAGLTAAATIATSQGDAGHARLYQAVADDFQRNIKNWTVTSTGPDSDKPYFIRLSRTGDPNAAITYNLGNGSVDADQRAVLDGGFQELVRLGELSPTDPDVVNSLAVLDQISATTPTGTGYYRYGTSAPGSEDGYGDCWTPDATDCMLDGQPWPTTDHGSGHLWPVLSGERAETAIAQGDSALARQQLGFLLDSASGEGLVPEQVWEDPDLAQSPYGSDPTTASIGFRDGHPAGSAAPLTWAQAQEVRLLVDLDAGTITDRPSITADRYLGGHAPGNLPMTITTPTPNQTVAGTITVSGTTAPNANVDLAAQGIDSNTAMLRSIRSGSDGSWSVKIAAAFGTDVLTATATTPAGTGYAQVTVIGDLVGGTTDLDVTDPANDDNGPGTYQYPTSSSFVDGSFDITRFQVLTKGDTVYLRTTLRTLVPTFGNTLGAQLLDIFVNQPGSRPRSSAAPYPSRNFTLAQPWSQRLEVQGFAAPVWVDATGRQAGSVTAVVASTAANTVTIALPKAAFGGEPATGWSFAVTLTGQDGFSGDQARAFTPTPQDYSFGVCAAGSTSPICAVDPNSVPKIMDTITPPGVSQAAELDPTDPPVTVAAVPVQ